MSPTKVKKQFVDDHTLLAQAKASNPRSSAWVSANAGSGKTYVLTQRVVRLLLSGCDPSRILCLTFTNAAAAEMSNRVFERLAQWAVMDEAELSTLLQEVTGQSSNSEQIDEARRLFARALETPGGLKIQTIHAFCEALLHQFPLEANIAGHFDIIDEMAQKKMIKEAQKDVILSASSSDNPKLGDAFSQILAMAGDQKIEKTFEEVIKKRKFLQSWFRSAGGVENAVHNLRRKWNIGPEETSGSIIENSHKTAFLERDKLLEFAEACEAVTAKSNLALASALREYAAAQIPEDRYRVLEAIFLTKKMEPKQIGSIYTKKLADSVAEFTGLIDNVFSSFVETRERVNLLRQIEASNALFVLAEAIIARYEQAKSNRGLLDFDDLISRTADLLGRSNASLWVQYKLDQGIDHVLVDEAQDTNPHQWQVIRSMVADFFSGHGARDIDRTVFAVGDEKQSIYSFQGAEPKAFADQRDFFTSQAGEAGRPFEPVELKLSFRSTPDVLTAVDEIFSIEENYAGLSRDREKTLHDTVRQREAGNVDIWPLIVKQEAVQPEDWALPVDHLADSDPQVALAMRIANKVAHWITNRVLLDGKGRPVKAGDIIVLVRNRDRFATALTRELKRRAIPVAGSDRLSLTNHIAVQDLLALGQVILLPQDDLSLAAILKSPLYGFSEELLFKLATERGSKSLFESLGKLARDNEIANAAFEHLQLLRKRADQMPVYEFYSLLLGKDGVRSKFLARLGEEAEDVLDAFLAQTLDHEQVGLPGLESFIDWLHSSAPVIKREFDPDIDEVRIMTVHAAKGLEAPIVFLVDKTQAAYHGRHDPVLLEVAQPETDIQEFLWLPDRKNAAPVSVDYLERNKKDAEAEYLRLLYVAMTRAEDRLIVCGTQSGKNPDKNCWHSVVLRALEGQAEELEDPSGDFSFHRWKTSAENGLPEVADTDTVAPVLHPVLPAWADEKLPAHTVLPRPLTPSGAQALIDAKVGDRQPRSPLLAGDDNPSSALLRGTAIHRLLQTLPDIGGGNFPALRRKAAQRYLAAKIADWPEQELANIIDQVFGVIEHEEFFDLFDPGISRAEVAISGTIELAGGPRLVTGQIDRLIVGDNAVTIIDYKTNRLPPQQPDDVPLAYITQLALYHRLVGRIYPSKPVKSALLWTETPDLMFIPDRLLDEGFKKIAQA